MTPDNMTALVLLVGFFAMTWRSYSLSKEVEDLETRLLNLAVLRSSRRSEVSHCEIELRPGDTMTGPGGIFDEHPGGGLVVRLRGYKITPLTKEDS